MLRANNTEVERQYERLQADLESRVRPDGLETRTKREISETLNKRDLTIVKCKNLKDETTKELLQIKDQSLRILHQLQAVQDKSLDLQKLEEHIMEIKSSFCPSL
jgi:shikimate kinase